MAQTYKTMGCGPSSVKRDTDELDRSRHPASRENSHTAKIDGFPFLEYMQNKQNATSNKQ